MYRFVLIVFILLFRLHLYSQYDSIYCDSVYRTYKVTLPNNYKKENKYPLLLAFHNNLSDANNFQESTKLDRYSDSLGYIIVYPEAIKDPNSPFLYNHLRIWNAGNFKSYSKEKNINDIEFINQLLKNVINKYSIDTLKIYGIGYLEGGILSYKILNKLIDKFAAFTIISSIPLDSNTYTTRNSTSVLHLHSLRDKNISFYGGYSINDSIYYPSLDSLFNLIANNKNCYIIDTLVDNIDVIHKKYWNNRINTKYELLLFKNKVIDFSMFSIAFDFFKDIKLNDTNESPQLLIPGDIPAPFIYYSEAQDKLFVRYYSIRPNEITVELYNQNNIKLNQYSAKCNEGKAVIDIGGFIKNKGFFVFVIMDGHYKFLRKVYIQ